MDPLAMTALERLAYILAAVSAAATLAGIGFALYGWFNAHTVNRLVDKAVRERLVSLEKRLNEKQVLAEEATQKIMSAYALSGQGKHEEAVQLLRAALEVKPDAYNGYTALGYECLAIGEENEAIEAFREAANRFPDRFEPYFDLARIYATLGEQRLAFKFIRDALSRKKDIVYDIESDPAFDGLRSEASEEYSRLVSRAKKDI